MWNQCPITRYSHVVSELVSCINYSLGGKQSFLEARRAHFLPRYSTFFTYFLSPLIFILVITKVNLKSPLSCHLTSNNLHLPYPNPISGTAQHWANLVQSSSSCSLFCSLVLKYIFSFPGHNFFASLIAIAVLKYYKKRHSFWLPLCTKPYKVTLLLFGISHQNNLQWKGLAQYFWTYHFLLYESWKLIYPCLNSYGTKCITKT